MGQLQELLSELTINFNRNHMMEPTHVPRHPSSFLNCVTILYREAVRKKYGIIWEFSTNGRPHPPFFSFFFGFCWNELNGGRKGKLKPCLPLEGHSLKKNKNKCKQIPTLPPNPPQPPHTRRTGGLWFSQKKLWLFLPFFGAFIVW